MADISLIKAQAKDAPVLHALLRQLARELGKEEDFRCSLDALIAFGFASPPAFEAIIAWQDTTALGFILFFQEFSTWRGAPGIYVQDLYVSAEARGLGLGDKLTAAAIAQAYPQGARYMKLSVHNSNAQALGFYQATGFEPSTDGTVLVLEGTAFAAKLSGNTA